MPKARKKKTFFTEAENVGKETDLVGTLKIEECISELCSKQYNPSCALPTPIVTQWGRLSMKHELAKSKKKQVIDLINLLTDKRLYEKEEI
jgi:hypothetical protein